MNLISPAGPTEAQTVTCTKSQLFRLPGDHTMRQAWRSSCLQKAHGLVEGNKINHQAMTVPWDGPYIACFTNTASRTRELRIIPWKRKALCLQGPSMLRDPMTTPSSCCSRSNTNPSPIKHLWSPVGPDALCRWMGPRDLLVQTSTFRSLT